jgi:hypothetical protein
VRIVNVIIALILSGLVILGGCASADGKKCHGEHGFVSIFDGKTINGWTPYRENGEVAPLEKSGFEIADGCIHVTGKGGAYWLAYKEPLADFTLSLECKLTKDANSGIFVRCPGPDMPAHKGYEIQILETHGDQPNKNSSGAIYDVLVPMRNMVSPPGEWNKVEVTCRGKHTKVVWNGFKVIDVDLSQLTEIVGSWNMPYADKPLKGLIGVQNHGSELWFRNIRVKKS